MADAHAPEDFRKHLKAYTLVGLILFAFTAITVGVAEVDIAHYLGMGPSLNYVIGLAIASFKAGLVALIFMHLNHEKPLIYKVLVFTFFFFAGMLALFIFALKDPITL